MISLLVLALSAASAPLEARIVALDVQRPVGTVGRWYNRVDVEFESPEARSIRLCPGDASVLTERRKGSDYRFVDRFQAHALAIEPAGRHSSACQDVALAAGAPRTLSFYVAAVPGGRHRGEDRYTFDLMAGERLFRFVEESRPER